MSQYNKKDFKDVNQSQDNPVLNDSEQIAIQKKPGVYMIHCLINDYRYYGESSNISSRIAGHRYKLRNNKHWSKKLQKDWNEFGENSFLFTVLYIGLEWEDQKDRLQIESELISRNCERSYNVFESFDQRRGILNPFFEKRHSEKTKQLISTLKKGIPNDRLGRKISINGQIYPSVAEASRQLGHSRRLIRERVNNEVEFPEWYPVSDEQL